MKMTVWKWPCSKKYYLKKPWMWVKHLFSNIHAAHMRITKGYCYSDIWSFNEWFTSVAPKMLRYMAVYGAAYPGTEPFMSEEEWSEWLLNMAHKLEKCSESSLEELREKNEYAKQMNEIMLNAMNNGEEDINYTMEEKIIRQKYFQREKELMNKRTAYMEETFKELGKYWDKLWD